MKKFFLSKNILILLYTFLFLVYENISFCSIPLDKNKFNWQYVNRYGKQLKTQKDPVKVRIKECIKEKMHFFAIDSAFTAEPTEDNLSTSGQERSKINMFYSTKSSPDISYCTQDNTYYLKYLMQNNRHFAALIKKSIDSSNADFTQHPFLFGLHYFFLLELVRQGETVLNAMKKVCKQIIPQLGILREMDSNKDILSLIQRKKAVTKPFEEKNYDKKLIQVLNDTLLFYSKNIGPSGSTFSLEQERAKNRFENNAERGIVFVIMQKFNADSFTIRERNQVYGELAPGKETYQKYLFDQGILTDVTIGSSDVRSGFFISQKDVFELPHRNLPGTKPEETTFYIGIPRIDNNRTYYFLLDCQNDDSPKIEMLEEKIKTLDKKSFYSITTLNPSDVLWLLRR